MPTLARNKRHHSQPILGCIPLNSISVRVAVEPHVESEVGEEEVHLCLQKQYSMNRIGNNFAQAGVDS
eukprot:702741-Pleurochrysis_carterae.AAC.1